MKEQFNYDTFVEKIEDNEYKATKYRESFIPNTVYKYQPIGKGRMRSKRLTTIKKEQVWASQVKYLNDPFEFKMLYADQGKGEIKEFYEDVLERNEVICLSGTWNSKLMWSHYADSHSGICLEYAFDGFGKGQVFPVTYVSKRQSFEEDLLKWIENKDDAVKRMCNGQALTGKQMELMHGCGKIMYTKDAVWKYEKEYRIVTRNHLDIEEDKFDAYKEEKGSLHSTSEFGMKLSKVNLGLNCTEENRDMVIDVVRKVNDKRVKDALGRKFKDKKRMYNVLYDMGDIVTIWEIYADKNLKLKRRKLEIELISKNDSLL